MEVYAQEPTFYARASGRVNLIGKMQLEYNNETVFLQVILSLIGIKLEL